MIKIDFDNNRKLVMPITRSMTDLTRAVLAERKVWDGAIDTERLQQLYAEVLDLYIAGNYPDGAQGTTLMCAIHDAFTEGHNCVGCNLEEQSVLLIRFLAGNQHFSSVHLASVQFHMLLYLLAERYLTYIEFMELPKSQFARNFTIFQRIVQWANFLKHPKSFVLAHHPSYRIDGLEDGPAETSAYVMIDDKFVKTYYSGGDNNGKLRGQLAKRENVLVSFPNPVELIRGFVTAQQKFVELIAENKIIRELLADEATIKKRFDLAENN